MAEGDDFARRLVVGTDARGYGGTTANWQRRTQSALNTVLDRAAERAGLHRSDWWIQEGGDGELAVLPEGEPEPRVVDDYVRHLHAELRRHNRDVPPGRELRLRMSIHYGPAVPAAKGFAGAGLVVAARLCDSAPLRAALEDTGAALAVVLSEPVYTETVAEEHTSLDAANFRQVTVQMKEFTGRAWIWVPEHDLDGVELDEIAPDRDEPDEAAEPEAAGARRARSSGPSHFTGAKIKARNVAAGDINLGEGGRR